MAEAEVRRAFDARREALRDAELCETTKLRVEHAAQVERLQRRVVAAALCASGGEQVRGTHFSLPTRHLSSRTNDPDLPHPSQVSTKVHALGHLAKLKIAQETTPRRGTRVTPPTGFARRSVRPRGDVAEKPESAVAVGGLLATQERELRDLRVAHRARRLRLERQIADELQRRGLPPDAGAVAGVRAEWAASDEEARTTDADPWLAPRDLHGPRERHTRPRGFRPRGPRHPLKLHPRSLVPVPVVPVPVVSVPAVPVPGTSRVSRRPAADAVLGRVSHPREDATVRGVSRRDSGVSSRDEWRRRVRDDARRPARRPARVRGAARRSQRSRTRVPRGAANEETLTRRGRRRRHPHLPSSSPSRPHRRHHRLARRPSVSAPGDVADLRAARAARRDRGSPSFAPATRTSRRRQTARRWTCRV